MLVAVYERMGSNIVYDSRSELDKIINLLPFFVRFSVENIFDLFPTELYGEEGQLDRSFLEASKYRNHNKKRSLGHPSSPEQKNQSPISIGCLTRPEQSIVRCITRSIVYALFCIAVGFVSVGALPARAAVAPVASEVTFKKKEREVNEESHSKGHEYSDYTRSLLEEVSWLLKCIEETRRGNGSLEEVGLALKAVKAKKEGLQGQIMEGLYSEEGELKKEKLSLENRAEEIMDEAVKVRREYENLVGSAEKERMQELEERMRVIEEDYSRVWDRVGEIEDAILRRETMAMSLGIRELCFIQRECEELVKRFNQEMRRKGTER
ncbi:hypothetical protein GH714_001262 [Hevea brasiliensis]|uniref:Uncharacterized protein n=1 Tax=Hevea brasiliensis TaxID=3981 RepID=A0A6A6KHL0_HEVBR|nr:hypothetical protein GH714_001262 [Hevea brasiliensis]